MKFKIEITREVIDKSLMCGVGQADSVSENCAFAVAFNELVPAIVGNMFTHFFDREDELIQYAENSEEQRLFISTFDGIKDPPHQRYTLVGQTFDVEIPDEVIEYWYGDASKATQKIIDNPIIKVI